MQSVVFGLYRWHGTSYDEFREHYLSRHVEIGKRLPHVKSYSIFLVADPGEDPPPGPPRPDAFAVMDFESEEEFQAAIASDEFRKAQEDNRGFIGHYDSYQVERLDLI